jgi:hypothetical protein
MDGPYQTLLNKINPICDRPKGSEHILHTLAFQHPFVKNDDGHELVFYFMVNCNVLGKLEFNLGGINK